VRLIAIFDACPLSGGLTNCALQTWCYAPAPTTCTSGTHTCSHRDTFSSGLNCCGDAGTDGPKSERSSRQPTLTAP